MDKAARVITLPTNRDLNYDELLEMSYIASAAAGTPGKRLRLSIRNDSVVLVYGEKE